MAAPTVGPKPVTTFRTPSGIPALAIKISVKKKEQKKKYCYSY